MLTYSAKVSFKIDGKIQYFHAKEQLRRYMHAKSALEKIFKNTVDRNKSYAAKNSEKTSEVIDQPATKDTRKRKTKDIPTDKQGIDGKQQTLLSNISQINVPVKRHRLQTR